MGRTSHHHPKDIMSNTRTVQQWRQLLIEELSALFSYPIKPNDWQRFALVARDSVGIARWRKNYQLGEQAGRAESDYLEREMLEQIRNASTGQIEQYSFQFTIRPVPRREFSTNEAHQLGRAVGVPWDRISVEQFRVGMVDELRHHPLGDVSHDDAYKTGRKVAERLLAPRRPVPDPHGYRAKWDALLALGLSSEKARYVARLSGPTILGMLRWNDKDGDYPSAWGKHEAGPVLLIQAIEHDGPQVSLSEAERLLANVSERAKKRR